MLVHKASGFLRARRKAGDYETKVILIRLACEATYIEGLKFALRNYVVKGASAKVSPCCCRLRAEALRLGRFRLNDPDLDGGEV